MDEKEASVPANNNLGSRAQIRALVRRLAAGGQRTLVHGPLTLDLESHKVQIGSRIVNLSPRRWSLLLILLSRTGKTVSKEMLRKVLGEGTPASINAIEETVSRLRRELEPAGIRLITVRFRGYRLEPPQPSDPSLSPNCSPVLPSTLADDVHEAGE